MQPERGTSATGAAGPGGGTVLGGRYRLGRLVGLGGMGEVWAGEDQRLGRPVAVKVLRADLAAHAEIRARFEAEARAAARLSHPHAVGVYDSGEDDGRAYIVMECLPGTTLADELASGPLAPEEVRRMALQVLDALGEAHRVGLLHRDIKPGNILRAANGSWKLADFGIAKGLEPAPDLTSTGLLVGTPAYLAPERIDGQAATPATDLYSLGVVLFEALTGQRPFEGRDAFSLAAAIKSAPLPPVASLRPQVPAPLAAVVQKALARSPEQRYPGASALAAALAPGPAPPTMAAPAPTAVIPGATVEETLTVPIGEEASTVGLAPPSAGPGPLPEVNPGLHGWRWAAMGIAVVMVLVLWVALSGGAKSPGPTTTSSTTPAATAAPATTAAVPASLSRALDQLAREVRP